MIYTDLFHGKIVINGGYLYTTGRNSMHHMGMEAAKHHQTKDGCKSGRGISTLAGYIRRMFAL
jgi:NO-binding membrane sensor protein with MHYT domain